MTHHSTSGQVSGVTLAALVKQTDVMDSALMYEMEVVELEDRVIVPSLGSATECNDEMFAMLTALETDFALECDDVMPGHCSHSSSI